MPFSNFSNTCRHFRRTKDSAIATQPPQSPRRHKRGKHTLYSFVSRLLLYSYHVIVATYSLRFVWIDHSNVHELRRFERRNSTLGYKAGYRVCHVEGARQKFVCRVAEQVATGSTGRQDGGHVVDFQIRIWSENGEQVSVSTFDSLVGWLVVAVVGYFDLRVIVCACLSLSFATGHVVCFFSQMNTSLRASSCKLFCFSCAETL